MSVAHRGLTRLKSHRIKNGTPNPRLKSGVPIDMIQPSPTRPTPTRDVVLQRYGIYRPHRKRSRDRTQVPVPGETKNEGPMKSPSIDLI